MSASSKRYVSLILINCSCIFLTCYFAAVRSLHRQHEVAKRLGRGKAFCIKYYIACRHTTSPLPLELSNLAAMFVIRQ
jgi:hypothetical protein